MNAAYLVARWIKSKLNSYSKYRVINWLTGYVGGRIARFAVTKVVTA